jgi:hypothetical protein
MHTIDLYNRWKNPLIIANIIFDDIHTFENRCHLITRKCCSTFAKEYYCERYSPFFSDEIVEAIWLKNKEAILKKRGSAYDVDNIMQKRGISREAAEQLVATRKQNTAGTLARFIKKYGEEEGTTRYYAFCEKSAHSLDTFVAKYGDTQGKIKYEEYLKSKSSSLDMQILRYGVEKGTKAYTKQNAQRGYSNTLAGQITKYGEVEGHRRYNNANSKRRNTLRVFIEKYGEEIGTQKHIESRLKRSANASNLHRLIDKYGEFEGSIRHYKRSSVFRHLLTMYDSNKALSLYKDYLQSHNLPKECVSLHKSPFWRMSKRSSVSKTANKLFAIIGQLLSCEVKYGTKSQELSIFDEKNLARYYYDAYIPKYNLIIEFNGIAYHPKEKQFDWVNPFGKGYTDIWPKDEHKKHLALNAGYNYLVLWSDQTLDENIKRVKEIVGQVYDEKNQINYCN